MLDIFIHNKFFWKNTKNINFIQKKCIKTINVINYSNNLNIKPFQNKHNHTLILLNTYNPGVLVYLNRLNIFNYNYYINVLISIYTKQFFFKNNTKILYTTNNQFYKILTLL